MSCLFSILRTLDYLGANPWVLETGS